MKKRLKVITAFLLMIVMAASGTCVFAGTDVQPAGDEPQAGLDIVGEGEAVDEALPEAELPGEEVLPEEVVSEEVAAEEAEAPAQASSDLELVPAPAATVEFDEEEENISLMGINPDGSMDAATLNYTAPTKLNLAWTDCYYYGNSYGSYEILKINVKTTGKLWVDAQEMTNTGTTVIVGKYNANTKEIDYTGTRSGYISAGQTAKIGIGGLDVKAGGSYCIGVQNTKAGQINLRAYVYPYATRTLPVGKCMMASGAKGTSNDYSNALFRIKPAKTGYIRVYLTEYGSSTLGRVQLLNSKKKAVANSLWYSKGSSTDYVVFGVKKGVTYYLKTAYCQGGYDSQYVFGLSYKNYAAKLRANTSKKKATTLKRKAKYISTAMPATGKSGSQWYKFKVTKKRATQFNIDARNIKSGKMTVTIYCGKKKVGSTSLVNGKVNPIEITYSTTYGKAKKGTYYVKITKSAKANGAYKVRYAK